MATLGEYSYHSAHVACWGISAPPASGKIWERHPGPLVSELGAKNQGSQLSSFLFWLCPPQSRRAGLVGRWGTCGVTHTLLPSSDQSQGRALLITICRPPASFKWLRLSRQGKSRRTELPKLVPPVRTLQPHPINCLTSLSIAHLLFPQTQGSS